MQHQLGYLSYEAAIGAKTVFVFGVMGTKYLLNVASVLGVSVDFDSPSPGRLRYIGTITKNFSVNMDVSFQPNGIATLKTIHFWPFKNGVVIPGASSRTSFMAGAAEYNEAQCNFTISMSTNDYLELYASDETSTVGIQVSNLSILVN
jgi:hypothetical protein